MTCRYEDLQMVVVGVTEGLLYTPAAPMGVWKQPISGCGANRLPAGEKSKGVPFLYITWGLPGVSTNPNPICLFWRLNDCLMCACFQGVTGCAQKNGGARKTCRRILTVVLGV